MNEISAANETTTKQKMKKELVKPQLRCSAKTKRTLESMVNQYGNANYQAIVGKSWVAYTDTPA